MKNNEEKDEDEVFIKERERRGFDCEDKELSEVELDKCIFKKVNDK